MPIAVSPSIWAATSFALAGIPVQETLPGTYTYHGKEKIVVACKDFTSPGVVLQDFASMKTR